MPTILINGKRAAKTGQKTTENDTPAFGRVVVKVSKKDQSRESRSRSKNGSVPPQTSARVEERVGIRCRLD